MSPPDPADPPPLAGKRIGLISSWLSRRNGGVFEAIVQQARIIRALGGLPVVIGLNERHSAEDRWRFAGAETHYAEVSGPPPLGFSRDFTRILHNARLDLLHCHGIWQGHVAAAAKWARKAERPLVISPHGMLDPWIVGRRRWKKHLARVGWERRAAQSAALFHALTQDEARDIRQEHPGVQVAVLPNPAPPVSPRSDRFPGPAAVYLGRIHEKKNLDALVDGWRRARPRLPADATLTIAGWGDAAGLHALEHAIGGKTDDGVRFVGTAFGSQKAALLDVARFVVLPSLSEGLPMAVLEAWAAGVPTLMSAQCHVPEGFAQGAAIDCGTMPASIAEALVTAFGMEETEWRAMSAAAADLASGPFGLGTITRKWGALYGALLD